MNKYAALIVAAVVAMPGLFVVALKKYVVFAGRASRLEFLAFFVITGVIGYVFGEAAKVSDIADIIGWVFALAMWLPFVSLAVRRLHDMGASGWWCLPYAMPPLPESIASVIVLPDFTTASSSWGIVGTLIIAMIIGIIGTVIVIIFLMLLLKAGNEGENKHGAPPQAVLQGA